MKQSRLIPNLEGLSALQHRQGEGNLSGNVEEMAALSELHLAESWGLADTLPARGNLFNTFCAKPQDLQSAERIPSVRDRSCCQGSEVAIINACVPDLVDEPWKLVKSHWSLCSGSSGTDSSHSSNCWLWPLNKKEGGDGEK